MWTYKSAIERTIPIYCTRTTYDQIASSFPYMISKAAASGSGALPSFDWRVMREDDEWDVCGVKIVPVPVHHGHYFDRASGPQRPLISLGFLIDSTVLYMSDVRCAALSSSWTHTLAHNLKLRSHIPEAQIARLASYLSLPSSTSSQSSFTPASRLPSLPLPLPRLSALILDAGALFSTNPSSSHFSLPLALSLAARLGAQRTYLTDLPHGVSHASWVAWAEAYSARGARRSPDADPDELVGLPGVSPRSFARAADAYIAAHITEAEDKAVAPARWVRPAFDGLVLRWQGWDSARGDDGSERVWDSGYD